MAQKTSLKISLKIALLGMGIFLPAFAMSAQSDKQNRGEIADTFLLLNPSVRAAALGGNQIALDGHLDSMFSNPAGLASLTIPEAWISHNQSFIDTKVSHVGFATPVGRNTFGISANYTDHGKVERTADDGAGQAVIGLGEFRYSTLLAHVGWGRKFGERMYLGATAKTWNDQQDSTSENGWAMDAGLIFKNVFPHFDLAAAGKNMGPRQNGYALPTITTVGAALRLPKRISLYSQMDFPTYADNVSRFGLEFDQRYFSLRAGYETATSAVDDGLANMTFGAGANIKGWRIDYAWSPKGDLGDQHQVSLTVGFGLTQEERVEAARDLDVAMDNLLKNRAEQYLASGRKALSDGNLKLASSELENATMWDPTNVDARVELERVREELQLFEANAYYHQGVKYAQQKQWLDATFYLKKAVKLVPSHAKALALLKTTEQAIRKDASDKPAITLADRQFNLGVKYYLDENYAAALREWRMLLKSAPNRRDLREYIEKGEKMQALRELEQLKREKDALANSADALAKQAHSYYSLNQVDKAIEMWERVVALEPDNKDAAEALKNAKARRHLANDTATDNKSRQIQDLNAKAMNAYINGDLPAAAAIWRRALELAPNDVRLQNNLHRIEAEMAGQRADQ
jgi:tetratricopeptide (TPR) repeat protein